MRMPEYEKLGRMQAIVAVVGPIIGWDSVPGSASHSLPRFVPLSCSPFQILLRNGGKGNVATVRPTLFRNPPRPTIDRVVTACAYRRRPYLPLHQLTVQIDYRDDLVHFTYDPKRIQHCVAGLELADCY